MLWIHGMYFIIRRNAYIYPRRKQTDSLFPHLSLALFLSLSMNTFMSEKGPEAFINPFSRVKCCGRCVRGHKSSITLTLYLQEETLQTAGGWKEKCVSVCRAWPKKRLLFIRIDNWYSICHRANNGCHCLNNKTIHSVVLRGKWRAIFDAFMSFPFKVIIHQTMKTLSSFTHFKSVWLPSLCRTQRCFKNIANRTMAIPLTSIV